MENQNFFDNFLIDTQNLTLMWRMVFEVKINYFFHLYIYLMNQKSWSRIYIYFFKYLDLFKTQSS